MNISKIRKENTLTISVSGRIDSNTAPELESAIKDLSADINELIFDLNGLNYISSAGLRVLLSTQKRMNSQGNMKLKNVNQAVMEILEITGFTDILTIE